MQRSQTAVVVAILASAGVASLALASPPSVNGIITGTEGWNILTEAAAAGPYLGGSATSSDLFNETASFNWWDGLTNTNQAFQNPRGDTRNFYVHTTAAGLYLALVGPTVPFNRYTDGGASTSNDQGDVYLAIDVSGGAAAGSLRNNQGHQAFGGKAVDFNGWRPTHIIGVQYVDNGGGGGGRANLERVGTSPASLADEAQSLGNGGFDWAAQINGFNEGVFEFFMPWDLLGLPANQLPVGLDLRFAAYATQNFAGFDVYDSLPGIGNGIVHEELGDAPGDVDTGGLLGASDFSFPGAPPGSNFVADLNFDPGQLDGIDTIEEYLNYRVVPAPSAAVLLGLTALVRSRRSR